MKQTLHYKWIATGILVGYLSPYIIALIKSYWSLCPSEEKAQKPKQQATNPYGN